MTIDEQRRIAKDMGRLAAWRGMIHHAPSFHQDFDLMHHWGLGVTEQCGVMSAAAAKLPLLFSDERTKPSLPLTEVNIRAIRHLREVSGAGLIDSRRAWDESGGDIDKALELLRRKSIAFEKP